MTLRRSGVTRGIKTQLLIALGARDGAVKDYAIIGLAGAGDDRGWDEVFALLPALLRRRRRSAGQAAVAMALAYLAQHLHDPDRRRRLVAFAREHWAILGEDQWFDDLWPEAHPGGRAVDAVPAPDSAGIRAWARHPLFQPLGRSAKLPCGVIGGRCPWGGVVRRR